MHRFLHRITIAACAFAAAVAAEAKPARIKLATLAPKGTSFDLILREMADSWKNAPDGPVHLALYTDGSLGGEGDMVRRMRLGQLHAGLLTASGIIEINPSVAGLQNIPMAFRSLDEAAYVRNRLAPAFEAEILEKGFVVLGWCDTGWWRIFSRKPLREPDDLAGEKLLVGVGSSEMAKIVRALRMQPVELNPTDILVSLQTGLVTVVPSPPIYALNGQFFQPAPHMLELNWAPLVGGLVMSRKAWEDLSPGQQELVRTTAAGACAKITTTARREMTESIAAMQKRGLAVQALQGDLEQRWIAFFEEIQRQARGTMVPEPVYDEIMNLLRDYRASNTAPASAEQPPAPALEAPSPTTT
jgi:TRAP-type C4-dicarboxylate transport system substrate-binding protein